MSATTPMRRKRATNLRQGEDDDSGELVRKRNARMAVFSALVDCTPSTSTNNNNNNRNYHEEDEEDDESRTTLLKSMSLKSLLKLKCETINKFLNFFDATHQARSNSKDPKYPIDLLPDRLEFHVMFRGAMSGENCPFMQAIRISSVSDETLRKAASATVHFFSFMTLRRNKVKERPSVPQCDYEMERVKRMTTVEKANLVGEFFCWFERVPPVRVSSSKVVATNGVEARVQVKETNTLMTTIRGLLAFWTYVGVIEPSSDRSPTEESRSIWRVVR
ncbi:Protein CBG06952 [Caenorhabditis briggsae]|nr:Protein CBG06952 [Caenorhabditis briggsae]CAP27384.1 Protein CBG06952 [Caenorhabditis briggsae]